MIHGMETNEEPIVLFWFRRDLRIEDNRGLYEALKSGRRVLPLFIFDPELLAHLPDRDDRRVNYIYSALLHLQEQLVAAGSTLLVFHRNPADVFAGLLTRFNVEALYYNFDDEPYPLKRDRAVEELLMAKGVSSYSFLDHRIFGSQAVLKPDGTPYTIFTPYAKQWKLKLIPELYKAYPSGMLLDRLLKMKAVPLPGLDDLGFKKSAVDLITTLPDSERIRSYDETRNFPAIGGTSERSVALRFGTVSIRAMVALALTTSEAWLNELIWREFFMMILANFPQVVTRSFKPRYDNIQWINDEKQFERWCTGETGYPVVDAGMRQLNATGLMHNRVRMVVASFLTKHLLIDWRWGEAWFGRKLFDYELSSNNGNWQWAAGCGCDAAPYFRVFNPYEQARKFDPENKYISKWVTEAALNYCEPVVEHSFARQRALEVYGKALK